MSIAVQPSDFGTLAAAACLVLCDEAGRASSHAKAEIGMSLRLSRDTLESHLTAAHESSTSDDGPSSAPRWPKLELE